RMRFPHTGVVVEALSRHHQRAETRKQGFWQGSKLAIGAGPQLRSAFPQFEVDEKSDNSPPPADLAGTQNWNGVTRPWAARPNRPSERAVKGEIRHHNNPSSSQPEQARECNEKSSLRRREAV